MSSEAMGSALKGIGLARTRFTYGLEKVPDDKLEWSPGGSAKGALVLAGKLTGFLTFLNHMIAHREMPPRPSAEAPGPATREEAKNGVHAAYSTLEATVAGLSDEDLKQMAPIPWGGEQSVAEWVGMAAFVSGYFQGQLNYLQLAYGDEDPNIPPEWLQNRPS